MYKLNQIINECSNIILLQYNNKLKDIFILFLVLFLFSYFFTGSQSMQFFLIFECYFSWLLKLAFGLALTYTMLLHDLFIHLTQLVFISCNLFGCRGKGVIYRDFSAIVTI